MRIGIMGTPINSGNRGVMALGASLVDLCLSVSPDAEMGLLIGNRDDRPAPFRTVGQRRFIPIVPYRLSPRSRLRDHLIWILLMSVLYRLVPLAAMRAAIARSTPWINAIAESDFVGDIRGGDSFSDIYGPGRFFLGFLVAWTVLLVKGNLVQFPQTYGPYNSRIARILARFLLKRSTVIIARDKQSQRVAQELVGSNKDALLSPDVAFCLEAIRPARIQLDPPLSPTVSFESTAVAPHPLRALSGFSSSPLLTPRASLPAPRSSLPAPLVGLNVNGLMYNGGYTRDNMFGLKLDYPRFLVQLVTALLTERCRDILLIPHTYAPVGDVESDNESTEKLRNALPEELRERVRLITAEYDQHELKWLIGQCDFFIGSRMHACIAALSQGVPCVGIAYSMKFAGVFESVGMEDWVVDARSNTNEEAEAQILSLYGQREAIRPKLTAEANGAQARLKEVFRTLVTQNTQANDRSPSPSSELEAATLG